MFRRYDAEAGNVREVLRWCRDRGDVETGLRISTAVSPCWIVRGSFAEGAEWLEEFLAAAGDGVPAAMRGAALIGQASARPGQRRPAGAPGPGQRRAWSCASRPGSEFWIATALNLLSETALHTGEIADGAKLADDAMRPGPAGRRPVERGLRAGHQGRRGGAGAATCARPQELAEEALVVMRRIDQQWGAARTLLGLGDLARMRRDVPAARRHYLAALSILREVDARPEIARCLAGLGRIAMEAGRPGPGPRAPGRQPVADPGTPAAGSGISRGLLAFATLAVREDRPDRAVQLSAAVTALRESAHLPPLPGSRTQRYLDAAAPLGERLVAALWAKGLDHDQRRRGRAGLRRAGIPVGPGPPRGRGPGGGRRAAR